MPPIDPNADVPVTKQLAATLARSNATHIVLTRSGGNPVAIVDLFDTNGSQLASSTVDLATELTAPERTQLRAIVDKLHVAAATNAGFTG